MSTTLTILEAMAVIAKAIHAETGPGTYHDTWLANIAMPILDQRNRLDLKTHEGANQMALILLHHFFRRPDGEHVRQLSTLEQAIVDDKALRVALDEQLQRMKSLVPSRNRALAITHLEDSIMRLGMDLKDLNAKRETPEPRPYPSSYDPTSTRVETTADGLKL